VIRDDQFRISYRPYAINLSTVTAEQHERGDRWALSGDCHALWFRRQGRTTRACLGTLRLWAHYLPEPVDLTDPHAILSADLDGRYGGNCHGRWDGTRYWGAQEPEDIEAHLAVLRPMLANYPQVPSGYDGWWRF
jgi:hypothetical protein